MDPRRIHHSRRFAAIIVLAVIIVGLRAYGIDFLSLQIAWHRLRLLSDDPKTGLAQVEALTALGDRGTPHLIWCVGHDLDQVQLAAIKALTERKVLEAGPALIRALDDGSASVREAANTALQAISGQDVGFNAYVSWANRRNEVRAWQDWWDTHRFLDLGAASESTGDRTAADGPAGD